MMKWLPWFKRKSAITTSAQLAELVGFGNASWMQPDYNAFSREGYAKNVIVYHCIMRISQAVADIPYFVRVDNKELEAHPVIDLLKRPNLTQGYKSFMRQLVMYRLLSGNSYVHANIVSTGRVMELANLRPDRVCIRTNSYNEPIAYDYTINGRVYSYPIDPVTLDSEILHMKEPHPLDDLYGLSPIQAAAISVDLHNEASEWNKKLLENSARPPGIFKIKDRGDLAPGATPQQLAEIRDQINEKIAGYRNAGTIPLINTDVEFQAIGISPQDMDWINGKNTSARDICLAFGYPPLLLGMPEGSTFNNVAEAKLALYEETVIPLVQAVFGELSQYLTAHNQNNQIKKTQTVIDIVPDLDQVSALSPRREIARRNARDDMLAGLITPNEARAEIGYDPMLGGDELLVPAGKLPLNFDVNMLDKSHFEMWLKSEGYGDTLVKEISDVAYKK